MMELHDYLTTLREDCPTWLTNFDIDNPVFNRQDFFTSRVVFYPGAYVDGHAIKLFGSSHAAHCFVYCDYLYEQDGITSILDGRADGYCSPILGYHTLARLPLTPHDLAPNGWKMHVDIAAHHIHRPSIRPYAFLEILERDPERDDNHGAHRLAILFLGSDGHATYDALFCQNNGHLPPFCLFLQDHGFGGNYSDFGNGGLMHQIATETGVFPDWQLVANNTTSWTDYKTVRDVSGDGGGMHNHHRKLHRKIKGA